MLLLCLYAFSYNVIKIPYYHNNFPNIFVLIFGLSSIIPKCLVKAVPDDISAKTVSILLHHNVNQNISYRFDFSKNMHFKIFHTGSIYQLSGISRYFIQVRFLKKSSISRYFIQVRYLKKSGISRYFIQVRYLKKSGISRYFIQV